MVRSDSDFGTLVLLAIAPYNPLKIRHCLRSKEYVRLRLSVHFPERYKLSGPSFCIVDFRPRAGFRQLSERVYLSLAFRFIGGDPALGLSPLQTPDCLL